MVIYFRMWERCKNGFPCHFASSMDKTTDPAMDRELEYGVPTLSFISSLPLTTL